MKGSNGVDDRHFLANAEWPQWMCGRRVRRL